MEVAKLFVTLAVNSAGYLAQLATIGGRTATWGQQLGAKIATALKAALMVGLVAITAAIAGLGVSAVKSAADLEAQMSGVKAVLGATETDALRLKDAVMELSVDPKLKVSAQEAADAVEMLARNGLGVEEILGGAARGTVLLANATGADFSTAADLATDVMALFKIRAEEMQTAVDGISSVVVNSKFSVDDYALALAQGGGVAATAGVEFSDFNASIAAISPLFASGSDAGTSFKTMLQRLAAPTGEASSLMAQLGLDFYDAEGNMRSMADISAMLNGSLAGLTEQQRTQALTTMFGSDAMRAAAGLMESGAVAYDTAAEAAAGLGVSIDQVRQFAEGGITQYEALMISMGQTSAADQAAERINNLKGDIEIFQSVLGGLKIQIGDALLPLFRDIVQGASEWLANMQPLAESIGEFIDRVSEGQSVYDAFRALLMDAAMAFGATRTEALELGLRFSELHDWFVSVKERVAEFLAPVLELIGRFVEWNDVLIVVGAVIGVVILSALVSLASAMAPVILAIAAGIAIVGLLRTAWENDWLGIQTAVTDAWENRIKPALEALWGWITGTLVPTAQDLWSKWTTIWWPAISAAVSDAWYGTILPAFQQVDQWITGTLKPVVQDLYTNWVTVWWPAISAAVQDAWVNVIQPALVQLGEWITGTLIPTLQDLWTRWTTEWWPAISAAVQDAWVNVIQPALQAIGQFITETLIPTAQDLYTKWTTVWWPEIKKAVETAKAAISSAATTISEKLTSAKEKAQKFYDTLKGFYDWIKNKVFEFKIKLPELPDWATPHSPIPLHTRWKEFGSWLNSTTFAFKADFSGFAVPGAAGGGGALDQIHDFLNEIANIANRFHAELPDQVKKFAEASRAVAEMVKPLLEAMDTLRNAERIGVPQTLVLAWAANVENIFDRIGSMAYHFDTLGEGLLDRTSKFADTATKALDLIGKTLTAVGDLAKLETTADIGGKAAVLASQLRDIVSSLAEVAVLYGAELLGHLEVFAKSAGQVLGLTKTAVDGLTALDKFAAEPVPVTKMRQFAGQIHSLVLVLAGVALSFGVDVLDALALFGQKAQAVLGIVKPGLDALAGIGEFVGISNARQRVGLFVDQLYLLVQELATAFGGITWGEALLAAAELPAQITKLFSVVKPGLDALNAINESTQIENLQQKVNLFRSQLMLLFQTLVFAFTVNGRFDDIVDIALALPEKINKVLSVVKLGLESLTGINEFVGIENARQKILLFQSQLMLLFQTLVFAFTVNGRFDDIVDAALDLPEKINKVLSVVKLGLESLTGINEFVGIENARQKILLFQSQLMLLFQTLVFAFTVNGRFDDIVDAALDLPEKVARLLVIVKPGLDALAGIAELTGIADMPAKIDAFANQVVLLAIVLTDAFNRSLVGLEEALASAGTFSELVKAVLSSVKTGVDAIASLAEFAPLANASETAVSFSAQLVDIVTILVDKLALAARNLVQADVEAAAGLAQRAKELTSYIEDVLDSLSAIMSADSIQAADLRARLDNIATAVDVAIERANTLVNGSDASALGGVLDSIIARMDSYVALAAEAGRRVGGGFVDGIVAGITAGAEAIADAVAGALNPPAPQGNAPTFANGGGAGTLAFGGGGGNQTTLVVQPGAIVVQGSSLNPQQVAAAIRQELQRLVEGV